jgi:hypothetical protein
VSAFAKPSAAQGWNSFSVRITAHIALLGQYIAGKLSAISDGSGGTLITASAPSPAETTSATLAVPHI